MKFIKFSDFYINFDLVYAIHVDGLSIHAFSGNNDIYENAESPAVAQARLDELLAILNNESLQDAPAQFYYGADPTPEF